jgi:hypothetical protein
MSTLAVAPTAAGRFIRAHFAAYRRLAKWPFLWRISVESLVVPLVIAVPIIWLLHLESRSDLSRMSDWKLLAGGVIIAPFIETILFQTLPVRLARFLGWGFWGQVVASMVVFALPHFFIAASSGIGAGIFAGFYIAFTYVHWRGTSESAAVWMTIAVHALHNFVPIAFAIAGDTSGRLSLDPGQC